MHQYTFFCLSASAGIKDKCSFRRTTRLIGHCVEQRKIPVALSPDSSNPSPSTTGALLTFYSSKRYKIKNGKINRENKLHKI
jgi:hypothetical protein